MDERAQKLLTQYGLSDRESLVYLNLLANGKQSAGELAKAVQMAVETGELKADTSATLVAFEFMSIVLGFYRAELIFGSDEATKLARAAYERLIEAHRR